MKNGFANLIAMKRCLVSYFLHLIAFFTTYPVSAQNASSLNSAVVVSQRPVGQSTRPLRSDWMKGKYGLMIHWLSPRYGGTDPSRPVSPLPAKGDYVTDLNKAVEGFDLQRFMRDFERTGAEWLIFTIGQNRGTYASPNHIIDSLAGLGHTSRRDLLLELVTEVKQRGKRFIAYLPCEVKGNETMHKPFAWNTESGTSQARFQELYLKAVREWSVRLGDKLDGWWFDGAYPKEPFHNKHINWEAWYAAARAGNPNAVVTFNDGNFLVGFTKPIRPEHDYTSGEALVLIDSKIRLTFNQNGSLFMPSQAYVEGTQCLYHALLPIDGYWTHGSVGFPANFNVPFKFEPSKKQGVMEPPIYSDAELQTFVQDFTAVGGAVTLNVNVFQEGYMGKKSVKQLSRMKKFNTQTREE